MKYSWAPEILCWTVGVALNRHQNDDEEEEEDHFDDDEEENASVAVVESFRVTPDCIQQVTWTSAKNETATKK